MVLYLPYIPLDTNGSENVVRCQVTKRKVSVFTSIDTGLFCLVSFLCLSYTCAKLYFVF